MNSTNSLHRLFRVPGRSREHEIGEPKRDAVNQHGLPLFSEGAESWHQFEGTFDGFP